MTLQKRKKKIELLAPAGSLDCFYAAVNAKCDALYFGGQEFSARSYAKNLTTDEMEKGIYYCKLNGIKTYVTLNTLIKDKEMGKALHFINEIYQAGVDGIILQDIGLAAEVRTNFPDLSLHASTQMTIHSVEGVRFLEDFGFERVVLSRELSLKEIQNIIQQTNIEIECFIHGALCYSYSGQCLMSSIIGGRSGNRGKCAQPCRLPYNVIKNGKKVNRNTEQYWLSMKDLNTLHLLPQIIESGIHSLKIEGRMKSPEYVAGVTKIYRKYIDLYEENSEQYKINDEDQDILRELFNRSDFTSGYLIHESKQMVTIHKPNHSGRKIAVCKPHPNKPKHLLIIPQDKLEKGDILEIQFPMQKPFCITLDKEVQSGKQFDVNCECKVKGEGKVFRVRNEKLLRDLEKLVNYRKKQLLKMKLKAKINEPLILTLQFGQEVIQTQGECAEEAINHSSSIERIKKQLSKTGNTPFEVKEILLDIDENLFTSIKNLNELRRKAIENLEEKIKRRYQKNKKSIQLKRFVKNEKAARQPNMSLQVSASDYLNEYLDSPIQRLYIEYSPGMMRNLIGIIEAFHQKNKEVFMALPHIQITSGEEIYKMENSKLDGYLLRTYGQVYRLKQSKKKLVVDYSLNTFNSYSFQFWIENNIHEITLSIELNEKEIRHLHGAEKEIIGYGNVMMMITKQCINNGNNQRNQCGSCSGSFILQDRLGEEFFVVSSCNRESGSLNKIYNGKPLVLLEELKNIQELNFQHIRLQQTKETIGEMQLWIQSFHETLHEKKQPYIQLKSYTKGHFKRGVK